MYHWRSLSLFWPSMLTKNIWIFIEYISQKALTISQHCSVVIKIKTNTLLYKCQYTCTIYIYTYIRYVSRGCSNAVHMCIFLHFALETSLWPTKSTSIKIDGSSLNTLTYMNNWRRWMAAALQWYARFFLMFWLVKVF